MRKGFTLVELIIYLGIFLVISLIFASVLVTFTKLQSRNLFESELNNQLNFALQTIQHLVADSATAAVFVNEGGAPQDQDRDVTNTHLILRRSDPSQDPTKIYVDNGILVVKEGTNAEKPLTTDKAIVEALTFAKKNNYPSHDIVQITLRMDYNPPSTGASRIVQSAIGRASAATFDDSIYPGAGNVYSIGGLAQMWKDAFYSGVIETKGGVRLNTTATTQPACDSATRGIFYAKVTADVDDILVCIQNGIGVYEWKKITLTTP